MASLPELLAILKANGLVLRSATFGSAMQGWVGSMAFTCDPEAPVELGPLLAHDPQEEPTDPRPDVLENFLRKKAARGTE